MTIDIQTNDLALRKLGMDSGRHWWKLFVELASMANAQRDGAVMSPWAVEFIDPMPQTCTENPSPLRLVVRPSL
jgi:hypothetical protein